MARAEIEVKINTMKTTLRICEKAEAWTSCSTISPEDKLFLNPMDPVAQNLQPILHPTCTKEKEEPLTAKNRKKYKRIER